MKKLFALCLLLCLLVLPFAGCAEEPDTTGVRVAAMKGPTAVGFAKMMQDASADDAAHDYDFSIYTAADEFTGRLLKGELDMAALPANVAAALYARSEGAIRVLAVNTLGVVSIVEKGESVKSLSDLRGKKIYAVGAGGTPEYALTYLLSQNGMTLSDLTIEWRSAASEILPLLKTEEGAVAMIPQPFVTAACAQVEGLRVAVDLNAVWQGLDNGSAFVTGVLVARRAFVEEHPQVVKTFLEEYSASITYAQENVADTAALLSQFGIFDLKQPVIEKALPKCNVTYLAGADMKAALSGYLGTLYTCNPQAVGGKLPDDAFYYAG